jgi:hypothetical protein
MAYPQPYASHIAANLEEPTGDPTLPGRLQNLIGTVKGAVAALNGSGAGGYPEPIWNESHRAAEISRLSAALPRLETKLAAASAAVAQAEKVALRDSLAGILTAGSGVTIASSGSHNLAIDAA